MHNYVKVHIIITFRNPYIFVIREICLKYGRSTHFGRSKVKDHTMTLHTYSPTNDPSKNHLSTHYGIQEIAQTNFIKLMVTVKKSKVKSRQLHEFAHLQPLSNNPTKYQLLTLKRYCQDKIFMVIVTTTRPKVKSRSQHHVAQDFIGQGHYKKVKLFPTTKPNL